MRRRLADPPVFLTAWASMESAKKDGTRLLIRCRNSQGTITLACAHWDEERSYWRVGQLQNGKIIRLDNPVEWAPIPE